VETWLLKRTSVNPANVVLDPKSFYQHLIQCENKASPVYKLLSKTQSMHITVYKIGVYIEDELVTLAEGQTRYDAERLAAEYAIDFYFKDDHYCENAFPDNESGVQTVEI